MAEQNLQNPVDPQTSVTNQTTSNQVNSTISGQAPNQVVQQNIVVNQPPVNKEERIYGAIGYIPFLGLVALIFYPTSAFVRMHVRQGQFLFLLYFASGFLNLILLMIGLDIIVSLIVVVFFLAYFVILIYSLYLAFSGIWWKIPIIGEISEFLPIDLVAKFFKETVPGQLKDAQDDFQNRQDTLKAENLQSQPLANTQIPNQTDNQVPPQTQAQTLPVDQSQADKLVGTPVDQNQQK